MKLLTALVIVLTATALFPYATAQSNPAIGQPVLSVMTSDNPYESVSLTNLNILVKIPIRTKMGSDLAFAFSLAKNFSLSTPNPPPGGVAVPFTRDFGSFHGAANLLDGTLTWDTDPVARTCPVGGQQTFKYIGWTFTDRWNTQHTFSRIAFDSRGCLTSTLGASADDQSGLYLKLATNGDTTTYNVFDEAGNRVAHSGPITTTYSVQSRNLNTISVGGGFPVGTPITYTDTLGQLALTYSTSSGIDTYSYTDANGNTRSFVVTNTTKSWKPSFGCPADVTTAVSQAFPTMISFPDGSTMSFMYEPTVGSPSSITGRLASVTLPTGGSITYAYSGGTNGINCADGSTAVMTRTFAGNSTKFTHVANLGGNVHTSTTVFGDASSPSNETFYSFYDALPTAVIHYTGPTGNNVWLDKNIICYNNTSQQAGNNVTCAANAVKFNVTQTDTWHILPSMATPSLVTTINSTTSLTPNEIKAYDFGTSVPTLVSDQVLEYGTYVSGSDSCGAAAITNQKLPCRITTKDGSGATMAKRRFTRDTAGNVLKVENLVSGTTYLTDQFTYDPNGAVKTRTDVKGTLTTYTNTSCNNLLPTSQVTAGLMSSQLWNCNGAVATSTTDPNSKTVNFSYNDPFWRQTSRTDELNNTTSTSYTPTSTESALLFNGGASTVDILTTVDTFGRVRFKQTRQAPGSSTFDTIVYGYDTNGRLASVGIPCPSTAGVACPSAATTTTYDGLGRPLLVTDGGGGTVGYSYVGNDVLQTVGPAPAGENTKRKQFQYDGLGRLKSVCELTSGSGSVSCTQTSPQTGYFTQYTYDALGNLKTVSQSGQTRMYYYDMLSRLTSETNPETGTVQYSYDVNTTTPGYNCQSASAGDLVKAYDAAGNTECYAYDPLHRLTQEFDVGPMSSGQSRYYVYDAATVNGVTMANTKGRLAQTYTATCVSCTKITDIGLNYSARGK